MAKECRLLLMIRSISSYQLLTAGPVEYDHVVQAATAILQLLIQHAGLLYGARTGVENPGPRRLQVGPHQLHDHFVRDRLAPIAVAL
ncbi:MAG: hypothetical protein M3309_01135 [Actinomycetota bacterium]|nr:hypothetical protein [Actinomycetota bacterium]